MKKFLPYGFALLALGASAFAAGPGFAAANDTPLASAAGQPLYDSHDMKIGVIRGAATLTGQPAAIVSLGNSNHEVLITADSVLPRSAGGWATELSADSIAALPTYTGDRMPPA